MAKLTANTVLEHDGKIVTLAAGDDVPEWAEGMLGEHLFDGEDDKPRRRTATK